VIPTIDEAASALRAGTTTARGLLEDCLGRAGRQDALLGSFLCRDDEAARAAADRADALLADGVDFGPLHGIPVAVKDTVTTAGLPTTAQSLALPERCAPRTDAPAVARLRDAGAVVVGKTTTMEFAFGMPDSSKPFPLPRNPWDLARWSGGSSSGSANGVAAGFFLGAIGSDSGGSIRLPAAYCGVTGLKPTFGLVPVEGTIPLAPSLDTVGPIARSASDCAHLLRALAGLPARDRRQPQRGLAGTRVAVVAFDGVDDGAAAAFAEALAVLAGLGATVTELSLPDYDAWAAASQVVLLAEAFELHRANLQIRWSDYGVHTRRRLVHGAFFTAVDLERARRVLHQAATQADALLDRHDAIATLTAGAGSEPLAGLGLDGHMARAGLAFTRVWNPIGTPAVSVPIGFTSDRVPTGMQLVGARGGDEALLDLAGAYQRHSNWHRLEPPVEST
jgi:aspartyl-tRNA(Asn)/glutamyl-tRNA(Gln) amidotransferase subunit A